MIIVFFHSSNVKSKMIVDLDLECSRLLPESYALKRRRWRQKKTEKRKIKKINNCDDEIIVRRQLMQNHFFQPEKTLLFFFLIVNCVRIVSSSRQVLMWRPNDFRFTLSGRFWIHQSFWHCRCRCGSSSLSKRIHFLVMWILLSHSWQHSFKRS